MNKSADEPVMSFRVLRHRFKADKADDKKESQSPSQGENDHYELVDSLDESPQDGRSTMMLDDSEDQMNAQISSSGAPMDDNERNVFEVQLTQLQEQLMTVMIENQSLQSELNSFERIKCELVYERKRCEEMEKRLDLPKKKKGGKVNRSNSDGNRNKSSTSSIPSGSRTRSPSPCSVASDDAEGREDKGEGSEVMEVAVQKPKTFSLLDRVKEQIFNVFYNVVDDFTDLPPPAVDVDPEGDPLAVKTLKENIKRFGTEAKPYFSTLKGISELLEWKCAPYTLIVFLVYMYAAWRGWFLPLLFICLTFRLWVNYLRYRFVFLSWLFTFFENWSGRAWNVNFNFFDSSVEDKETEDKDLGVSDKVNLVLHVARKAQNILGRIADSLEKIKSLFLWRHPPATSQLFFAVFAAFILSCLLPTSVLFFYAGLLGGIKLFIIDNIYRRFPKVKQKYDSTSRLWNELPTDIEYERKYVKSEIDKYILPHDRGETASSDLGSEALSMDDRTFCELFSLPDSECPLHGWRGGRRCTLINREKSLTSAFKNGKLYLTHSFLCFERTKTPSPKNIVIPLADIARLEKAKPYSWMPGGGMAIEIAVVGSDKHFIFGAVFNRDEVFDSICDAGMRKIQSMNPADRNLPWVKHNHGPIHIITKQFTPFSLADVYVDSD